MKIPGGCAGFLDATVLFLIWLTKQTVGSGPLSAPEEVTAAIGGSVTVACQDEDVYWCVIAIHGGNIRTRVQLLVSHTVTVVTPTAPMALNHDEISWWATLRWILFILMLCCLISTHIAVWRIQAAKKNMSATTISPSQLT
ncbi:uncharacterized protein LOC117764429 isoform X2 [Hippoglossus hippoglossus]|uniref:uncharacterized protein LOC117764429 isoform X2 n=1 Tax=Hippoglossus hippoglossus TaxID=8267 RepID=UPI00148C5E08|nr:uncharacterized protein LOC117764429 isoform X2 [Hippoglossus hippoglossus]